MSKILFLVLFVIFLAFSLILDHPIDRVRLLNLQPLSSYVIEKKRTLAPNKYRLYLSNDVDEKAYYDFYTCVWKAELNQKTPMGCDSSGCCFDVSRLNSAVNESLCSLTYKSAGENLLKCSDSFLLKIRTK